MNQVNHSYAGRTKKTNSPTSSHQRYLIVLHGLTGSGKSTVCDLLENNWGAVQTHPISPYKRYLESIYQRPIGSLDTREGKAFIPQGCNYSMHELLAYSYHFWAEKDPLYSTRMLSGQIGELFEKGHRLVSTQSIRNLAELDCLERLKLDLGYRIIALLISRNGEKNLSSDFLFNRIRVRLQGIASLSREILNNGSVDLLHDRVIEALGRILC